MMLNDSSTRPRFLPPPTDVQNVKRVMELVRYFHPPIPSGRQIPVQTLEYLPGRYRGFLPGSVLVGEFFAFLIDLMAVVGDVKEVPRHTPVMLPARARSSTRR